MPVRGFLILLAMLIAGPALAQPRWENFAPDKSRLVLDAPELSRKPVAARELAGGPTGIRMFQYTWGSLSRPGAFVDVMMLQPTTGAHFPSEPDYRASILTVWPSIKAQTPVFADDEKLLQAPVGALRYRSMTLPDRTCLAFGGAVGAVLDGKTQMAGVRLTGDKWMYGLYCPLADHRFTPEGAAYSLQGFGWDADVARPARPAPATIAVAR